MYYALCDALIRQKLNGPIVGRLLFLDIAAGGVSSNRSYISIYRSFLTPFSHRYAGMPYNTQPRRGGQPQVQKVQQEEEKEADYSATSLRVI